MASTYTTKLGLAKPAHGDVDWHIPINENWDKIDTEIDKAQKISGTIIDTDIDCNGNNIINLSYITATKIRPIASDNVKWTKTGSQTIQIPETYMEGTFRLYFSFTSGWDESSYLATGTITINDTVVYSDSIYQGTKTHINDYVLKGNDVITFTVSGYLSSSTEKIMCDDTIPLVFPTNASWPS